MLKLRCLGLLLAAAAVAAEEPPVKNLTLSLSPSLAAGSSRAEELVFQNNTSSTKLSELLWDSGTLVFLGLEANLDWRKPQVKAGVFADLSFKAGLASQNGVIEDRDWGMLDIYPDYPDWLTHYSVHDNKTESALFFEGGAGMTYQVSESVFFKLGLAYEFMTFEFKAKGGSFLYPEEESEDSEEEAGGGHMYLADKSYVVCTYAQTWHIVSPEAGFYGAFNRFFNAEVSLKLSPFVWCNDVDHHLTREPPLTITGAMSGGLFVEPKVVFTFTPPEVFALSLSASYRNISKTRGSADYDDGADIQNHYKNISGAGYRSFNLGLSMKFRVF